METTEKKLSLPKIVLRILGFGLFFVLLMQLIGRFFLPDTNLALFGSYTGGGIYAEPADTVDVVALGSSDVCCAVSPLEWYEDYGFTSYTVGKSWASACDTYYMLRNIYKTQSPKVVILCTDTLYEKFNDNADTEYTTMRTLANWFPVIYYHDNWKSLTPYNLFAPDDYTLTDPYKGYYFSTDCENLQIDPDYMTANSGDDAIPLLQRLYLDATLRLCARHGSRVILATIPHDTWSTGRHDAVAAYAAQKGVPYLDYNVLETAPALVWDTDTFNYCHMNLNGAVKVTDALGAYLTADAALPDHRGDSAYAAWGSDLQQYRQQKADAETAPAA